VVATTIYCTLLFPYVLSVSASCNKKINSSTYLSIKQVSIGYKMVIITSALLKASFLAGHSELIFELSTHTRSFSVYLMVFSHFLFIYFFITSFIFFRTFSTFSTVFLIFYINSSTSRTLSIDFSVSP